MAFEYTPWVDAWNWLCEGEHGIVKLAMLVDDSCPQCNKFHEEVIGKLEEHYDWFQVRFVEAKSVPFPPQATPTGHFTYNFRHERLGFPDIRAGAGPAHLVERDLVTMRAMNVYQKHHSELTEEEKEQNELDKLNGHS